MPARHLVVGLDGADLSIVRELGPGALPNLHACMARGAYAHQRSVMPPATLPNWTTFLTGVDPGRHGVFDFTLREGERVRFVGGTVRAVPTVFARLDALALRTAVLFFPATYPPERLRHGVFVSGWDSPVAFAADASFVHPPSLHASIERRFGPIRFDDVDEFDAGREGFHATLPAALERRIAAKVELARWLLASESWDVFALYLGELDTASHHLFAHHDPRSPRHPGGGAPRDGLGRVYRAADAALGELLESAGGAAVELTVASDHGSGGSSDTLVHLNRALADAGLLTFRPVREQAALLGWAKDVALTRLPAAWRERVFRFAGNLLPSWLESRNRFGAIDFANTRAFSDELNYFPAVILNLAGREPHGTVEPGAVESTIRDVERALLALRDPWSGSRVVRAVHRREALFDGPLVHRAPDLVLELELDGGYSYGVAPSRGPGAVFEKLPREEHLGRKGRSLAGSHRDRGLFVACGPSVSEVGEIDCGIADAMATLLVRLGVSVPADASGRALFEILTPEPGGPSVALPEVADVRTSGGHDEAAIERRLRALGYVE